MSFNASHGNQVLCQVKLVSSNNYFVKIPRRHIKSLVLNISGVNIVQICPDGKKTLFCSVGGSSSQEHDDDMETVEIDAKMGLYDQEPVLLKRPKESSIGLAVRLESVIEIYF